MIFLVLSTHFFTASHFTIFLPTRLFHLQALRHYDGMKSGNDKTTVGIRTRKKDEKEKIHSPHRPIRREILQRSRHTDALHMRKYSCSKAFLGPASCQHQTTLKLHTSFDQNLCDPITL
jgi:hypothetical protein